MSFTIKCNNCGQEQKLIENKVMECKFIDISCSFDDSGGRSIDISCENPKCENYIDDSLY